MSLRKARARLIVSDDTGDVRSVEVFGHVLTADFAEVEVSEEVFTKLRDNPHIEVQVRKERPGKAEAAPEPTEPAETEPAEQPQG